MNFARCSLFAVGGLVFSLTCLPMDADAGPIIVGNGFGLPGLDLGTVGTEAMACTNSACNGNGSVPFNSYVGNAGGAGGVTATADAEFASNGIPAPALVNAQANINDLSVSASAGTPTGANGAGTAYAVFTDVLTFSSSSFQGVIDPFFQLSLDPMLSVDGGRTYSAQLSLYWYGPGTSCDSIDSAYSSNPGVCQAESTGGPGTSPNGFSVPALTGADTLVVFSSLYGDAAAGGSVSDPDSVMISNLPAGVSIISEGGGTYTAAPSPAPVPEPASMMLFGTGVIALVGRRFRRSRAQ
jgi:hypothetical protein